MVEEQQKAEIFEKHRARLFGIAYRMLGTREEAEDIVQEAYLRWHKAQTDEIETPEAWLVTVTTRLSIDRLRKAAKERENYIGPWLPEPLIISDSPSPEEEMELASNLSLAFMFLLERLSPLERAVFLLHDIFDCGYADIARIVGKTETASRQLIHRARERVRTDRQRFQADEKERKNLIEKFIAASKTGDENAIFALFGDEIAMVSDGGGKVAAARKIIFGRDKLSRVFATLGTKYGAYSDEFFSNINGELGTISFLGGKIFAVTTFDVSDGKVSQIYRVMNPDKLKRFPQTVEEFLKQTDFPIEQG